MDIAARLKLLATAAVKELYQVDATAGDITITITKPEFQGDYTIVLFALIKQLRKSPDQLGNELGAFLVNQHGDLFSGYSLIKGFLNLVITDEYWHGVLQSSFPILLSEKKH